LSEQQQDWRSFRTQRWLTVIVSVLILVPCWWHRHIEAGDLGSHAYNAWLAQLVAKGQAPGLYVVPQWNNVLVDWLLLQAGNLFGFALGEKLVISFCVLVFFWGVFALIAAASGRPPWVLAPCIAMLTYGYVFNMGFFNYYLSLGLGSLSLALLWKGKGIARIVGVLLIPLVLLAHPIGMLWLVGTAVYIFAWTRLPGWWKAAVPAAAILVLLAVHWYLLQKPQFEPDWETPAFYILNGADQLVLYSRRYALIAAVAVLVGAVCVGLELLARRRERSFWQVLALPFGLYVVAIIATALLPQNLRTTPTGGLIGLLVSRLTVITAIFGLCALHQIRPRRLELAAFAACALAFFGLLYRDTAVLNRMEASADGLVAGLPFGTRVLETIWAPPGSHIWFIGHFADRSCIQHCFSFGNYEPSTGQFRVRAREGNKIATASYGDSGDMQSGEYEVQDEDLPMKEIYQCDPKDLTKLCIRDLAAGEMNGRLGYKPPSD
jgi:hypothetical protein